MVGRPGGAGRAGCLCVGRRSTAAAVGLLVSNRQRRAATSSHRVGLESRSSPISRHLRQPHAAVSHPGCAAAASGGRESGCVDCHAVGDVAALSGNHHLDLPGGGQLPRPAGGNMEHAAGLSDSRISSLLHGVPNGRSLDGLLVARHRHSGERAADECASRSCRLGTGAGGSGIGQDIAAARLSSRGRVVDDSKPELFKGAEDGGHPRLGLHGRRGDARGRGGVLLRGARGVASVFLWNGQPQHRGSHQWQPADDVSLFPGADLFFCARRAGIAPPPLSLRDRALLCRVALLSVADRGARTLAALLPAGRHHHRSCLAAAAHDGHRAHGDRAGHRVGPAVARRNARRTVGDRADFATDLSGRVGHGPEGRDCISFAGFFLRIGAADEISHPHGPIA